MVLAIIIITALVSIYGFSNQHFFARYKFNPYGIKYFNEGWRFFTYAFLHAGWAHLFINMFVFYSFGDFVLNTFHYLFGTKGYVYFLLLYIGGIIFSVLVDFGKHKEDVSYSAVGASGAVSAVVFSSIILHPTGSLYLFLIPIPIPAIIFGVLYLIYSAYMARRGISNVGHSAHFWGALFGVVFTIAIKPVLFLEFLHQIGNWLGIS